MRTLLIRCYPAQWRARYGEEFAAILDECPLGPFDVFDILLGALDARLRMRGRGVGTTHGSGFEMSLRIGGIAAITGATIFGIEVLSIGRSQPFAGDFGFVWFIAAMAMWLGDAAFGLVTLRLGVMNRLGALALAIGSALAFLGVDRLGLTSPGEPTIVEPLALIGIALNGMAWILLGLDLVLRSVASAAEPTEMGTV